MSQPPAAVKKLVLILISLGFFTAAFFSARWYLLDRVSPWYYGTFKKVYRTVPAEILETRVGVFPKNKNRSQATYFGQLLCRYENREALVSLGGSSDSRKEIEALLALSFPVGKKLEILVHPHSPQKVIFSYDSVKSENWLGFIVGFLFFAVVFFPSLIGAVSCLVYLFKKAPSSKSTQLENG